MRVSTELNIANCENYKDQLLLITWGSNSSFVLREVAFHSNSNWTFIALNLPYSKGTLRCNKTKAVNQFQYPGTEKRPSTTENASSE